MSEDLELKALHDRIIDGLHETIERQVADLTAAREMIAALEHERDVARTERNLLIDALTLHMRSTGIADDAMGMVDMYRRVSERAAEEVKTECQRLEDGWRDEHEKTKAARAERYVARRERDEARALAHAANELMAMRGNQVGQ